MNEKKITGVRVYILTVDSETNTMLKAEEEDPSTGHRTEVDLNFLQYQAPQTTIPVGFVPSIVILVGGQVSEMPQSVCTPPTMVRHPPTVVIPKPPKTPPPPPKKAAEDEQADKGGPPKV